jgi:hypothetical protein
MKSAPAVSMPNVPPSTIAANGLSEARRLELHRKYPDSFAEPAAATPAEAAERKKEAAKLTRECDQLRREIAQERAALARELGIPEADLPPRTPLEQREINERHGISPERRLELLRRFPGAYAGASTSPARLAGPAPAGDVRTSEQRRFDLSRGLSDERYLMLQARYNLDRGSHGGEAA